MEQPQTPEVQTPRVLSQLFWQEPQLLGSVETSTHRPLQARSPVGHWHCPETQVASTGQSRPQAPQLVTSVERSAQPPLQATSPVGQMQTPLVQLAPAGQSLPHAPQ